MSFTNIADIKDAAKMLDTTAAQWVNASPPEQLQSRLTEARESLQRGLEMADAPLRIAIVGEFNSGKTLLLNALMDSSDLFPCLLQPTTGNVLEVRLQMRREERPPEVRSATTSFFNKFEVEKVLEYYLKDLQSQTIEGLPSKISIKDLERFEQLLCKKFQDIRAITPKYSILAALEYVMALRYNQSLVMREERLVYPMPIDLIATSLTLSARPELSKGIQAIHSGFKQTYAQNQEKVPDKLTSKNLRSIFPLIRRVVVDVAAWSVPFGITTSKDCSTIAFLDFPGLGAESSSARDHYLCMTEIADAHAVLILFNGSNPGSSGASVMTSLFQRAGKLTGERTIVAVNRFDEFDPLPTDETMDSYYAKQKEGTTVGFSTILVPAKNLLSGMSKKFSIYVCSALCYLFEEKAKRPSWNFGNPQWFNDSKRQAAYTLYKRCESEFQRLIREVDKKGAREHEYMKEGLERYLEQGGVPSLRQDLVNFAMQRGEKLILEDSLKEVRTAVRTLDEIAPAAQETTSDKVAISPEVSYAAQEFYRVLELAAADTLPSGPSEYKRLKVHGLDQDVTLWQIIEREISSNVCNWPEWFAILSQGNSKTNERPGKPQKKFDRYKGIKKAGAATVPSEFNAFNERFRNTAQALTQQTVELIGKAVGYSLERFENHPDYRDAVEHFQSMIMVDKLPNMEDALPLLDAWQPTRMAEEEMVPMVLEKISDEVDALSELSYPYDGSKPCFWNLALIIRVQVQLVKTYRDKLSRLVAAAESQFQNFYCNEVLRAEILPLVRSALNKPDFLGEVALSLGDGGEHAWERVGQMVRSAVNKFKGMDSAIGASFAPAKPKEGTKIEDNRRPAAPKPKEETKIEDNRRPAPKRTLPPTQEEPEMEEQPLPEDMEGTEPTEETETDAKPVQKGAKPLPKDNKPKPKTMPKDDGSKNTEEEEFEEW